MEKKKCSETKNLHILSTEVPFRILFGFLVSIVAGKNRKLITTTTSTTTTKSKVGFFLVKRTKFSYITRIR